MLFTKKRRTPISGDIEMLEIRSSKKLGRKHLSMRTASSRKSLTRKSLSRKSVSRRSLSSKSVSRRSMNRKRKRSTSSFINYKKTKKINLRKLYRERVKNSVCRRKPKPDCDKNNSCMYTEGIMRKYCRKAHNQRI
jgi:hypothetical protein